MVDLGGLLGGDSSRLATVVERITERLRSGGVAVSPLATETVRLELSLTERPAEGQRWCVRVAAAIDTGRPAYLPSGQHESTRCEAMTRASRDAAEALIDGAVLLARTASGVEGEEIARRLAVALADSISDVLDKLGAGPRF